MEIHLRTQTGGVSDFQAITLCYCVCKKCCWRRPHLSYYETLIGTNSISNTAVDIDKISPIVVVEFSRHRMQYSSNARPEGGLPQLKLKLLSQSCVFSSETW